MKKGIIQDYPLPILSAGTLTRVRSIRFSSDRPGLKVYIQAGLHADEAPGYLVASRLARMLDEEAAAGRLSGEVIIVPVANPIGLGQWGTDTVQGRFDNSDHINFNRRYPDLTEEVAAAVEGRLGDDSEVNVARIRQEIGRLLAARVPGTQAEAMKLHLMTLSHDADIVIDLHCDHEAGLHVYMGSPLWPQHRDLAAQMGAIATLLAKDSGDTPFDEANSKIWWELAVKFPTVPIPAACLAATVELRGVADTNPHFIEEDSGNLFAFLQRRGVVAGTPPSLPSLQAEATPLEGVDYICATTAGVMSFVKKVGDHVHRGEVVALVTDPLPSADGEQNPIEKVISATEGVLFARCADRFTRPGKVVAKVAGKEPLAGKGPYLLTF